MGHLTNGFVKGRSSVSNLLEYSPFVLKSIESGCQMDSLSSFAPRQDDIRIRIGDCAPMDILVTSGVPQGSHVRSLFFIGLVNEIAWIYSYVQVLFMLTT
jgi:hypothetical protein